MLSTMFSSHGAIKHAIFPLIIIHDGCDASYSYRLLEKTEIGPSLGMSG